MKTCTKCKLPKEPTEFHKQSRAKNKISPVCKECRTAYYRRVYRENLIFYREKKIIADRKRCFRNKLFVFEYLETHPCVDCGERDPIVLEFDHKKEKSKAISELLQRSSIERIMREISKCEVRCANCHRRKTARQLGWFRGRIKESGTPTVC